MDAIMEETTTLAEILENTFLSFSEILPRTQGTPDTLIKLWTEIFNTNDNYCRNDIYKRIIDISNNLQLLSCQVSQSKRMKEPQKKSSQLTIDMFRPLVDISMIHSHASQFIPKINTVSCGQFGMIGYSVEAEFSQNVIPPEGIEEIISTLEEVDALLDDDELPLKLRMRLKWQISAVIWRLKHPEMESIDDAYEALGKITLVAHEMDRLCNPTNDDTKTHDIGTKLFTVLDKVRGYVETGCKVYETARKLEHVIKPLIEQ